MPRDSMVCATGLADHAESPPGADGEIRTMATAEECRAASVRFAGDVPRRHVAGPLSQRALTGSVKLWRSPTR